MTSHTVAQGRPPGGGQGGRAAPVGHYQEWLLTVSIKTGPCTIYSEFLRLSAETAQLNVSQGDVQALIGALVPFLNILTSSTHLGRYFSMSNLPPGDLGELTTPLSLVEGPILVGGNDQTATQSTHSVLAPADIPLLYFGPGIVPFRHIRVLGRGSFALVDEVEVTGNIVDATPPQVSSIQPGQIFARKIIDVSWHQKLDNVKKEIEALKKLQHLHIVEVKLIYEELKRSQWERRTFGIIMEPVADCTLKEYLEVREHGIDREDWEQPKFDRIKIWFGCLASGLAYIHSQHIRHKDIKPANILLKNGRIMYSDFGIARVPADGELDTQTEGHPGCNTFMYCAPEVAAWESRGRKADVFSLGCVFLEMLTVGLGFHLQDFASFRETDGSQAYHRCLDPTLRWLLHLRKNAKDRVAYCCATLNPDPLLRVSSEDLSRWISCQRDYSSRYLGDRGCRALGHSPVGKFWAICLHGQTAWEFTLDRRVPVSWAIAQDKWITRYLWDQTAFPDFPSLVQIVKPENPENSLYVGNWELFRLASNL